MIRDAVEYWVCHYLKLVPAIPDSSELRLPNISAKFDLYPLQPSNDGLLFTEASYPASWVPS